MNLPEFLEKAKAAGLKKEVDFYPVIVMQKKNGVSEGVDDLQVIGTRDWSSSWNDNKTVFSKEVRSHGYGRLGFLRYHRDPRFAGDDVRFREVTFEPESDAVAFVYDHDTASAERGRLDLEPLAIICGVGIPEVLKA